MIFTCLRFNKCIILFSLFWNSGGPYSAFGGHDASRGLATFSVVSSKDEYDDLSDLNTMEMDSVREWEMQFKGEGQKMIMDVMFLYVSFMCHD